MSCRFHTDDRATRAAQGRPATRELSWCLAMACRGAGGMNRSIATRSRSSHREALLMQQLAVGAPDFHAPVATVHRLTAIGAIALGFVRRDPQLRGLSQRVSSIPAMDDDPIVRRADSRKEDERTGHH